MNKLVLLPIVATLTLAACGKTDVGTATAREDYGPPPSRRSLDHVRIAAENGSVIAREKTPLQVTTRTARFRLGGVDCGSCAPLVAIELGQVPGVREARVSQTLPVATVEFDPARLTARQLLAAIARTGLHPREEAEPSPKP